jgi:WD40 repeat protein
MDEISTNFRLFSLQPGASQQDLKVAYKRLVKQWHPDRFAHDPSKAKLAEEKIKEINLAYASLKVYLENPHQSRSTANAATTVQKRTITAKEFYDRATDLVKDGKYQEATEELGRAIKKNPNYAEAYRYRGFLFSLLGFELRAEKDLKQAEFLGIRITQNGNDYTPEETRQWSPPPASTSSVNQGEKAEPEHETSEPLVSIELELSLAQELDPIYTLAASSNQRTIAVGHENGSISLWNTKTKRQFHSLVGHTGKVTCLKFSDDNQILFSGSEDGTVRLWNLSDGNFIKSLNTHKGSVNGLEICYLRKLLITAGHDGVVRVWDLKKSTLIRQILNHEAPVPTIALNSTGEITVCGTHDGSIRFCHTLRGGIVKWLSAHQTPVSALAFSQDGQHFASGAVDGEVMVWGFPSGDRKTILPSVQSSINALAFSINGQLLYGADSSGQFLVWDIPSGALAATREAHSSKATALLPILEDRILTAGADGSIHQWRVR